MSATKPRLLDLFCGEGGAGMGYSAAGFDVEGVDDAPARLSRYPFQRNQGDALEFLEAHGHEYDVIHASPPCTGYSRGTAALPDRLERYDRLIPAVRDLLKASGKPFVIENVEDARGELQSPVTLCWTHFYAPGSIIDDDGTLLWMRRHRVFESNVPLMTLQCEHPSRSSGIQCAGAYGGARRCKVEAKTIRRGGYVPSYPMMQQLLRTPWMSEKGCQLSIPPAYSQFIGHQIMDTIR